MQGCQSGARSLNATSELVAAVSQKSIIHTHLDYLLLLKNEEEKIIHTECKKNRVTRK